jgi:hypothetical protein
MTATVWPVLLAGVIATIAMDILSVVGVRLRIISPLSPNLIGRWFVSVARAHPIHDDIARASAVSHELAVAMPVHYAIGVTLAALYVWATSQLGWSPQNLGLALAFGLCTNVLPWFVMFPSMGYGLFGAHGPAGTRLFFSSLTTHALFGLGIWIGVRIAGMK